MQAAVQETEEFSSNFRGYLGALDELGIAPLTREAVERARPDVEEYIEGCKGLVELCAQGKPELARERLPEVQAVFDRLEISLGELGERIEQDADVVGLLYRVESDEDETDPTADTLRVNLMIAKQRNGPAGDDVRLIFRKGMTRYECASPIADEPAQ